MEIPEHLHCLFTAKIERQDDSYVISVPARELELGTLTDEKSYRVAILGPQAEGIDTTPDRQPETTPDQGPPVVEGETRVVEIENLGEQGDGIARVERGFVVIVPETEPTERVKVEVTDVRDSVAFASVTERLDYYE
jgi:predicted RNA-binding protein with TRAM domain